MSILFLSAVFLLFTIHGYGQQECYLKSEIFSPLDTGIFAETITIPQDIYSSLDYQILCVAGDSVAYNADGSGAAVKGNFSGIVFKGVQNQNENSSGTI